MKAARGEIKIGQHYAFRFQAPPTHAGDSWLRRRTGDQVLVKDYVNLSGSMFYVQFPDGRNVWVFPWELEDSETLMSVMPTEPASKPAKALPWIRCPVCPSDNITKSTARSYINGEADGPGVVIVTTEHTCDHCGASFWI
jgi:hypothetical protein